MWFRVCIWFSIKVTRCFLFFLPVISVEHIASVKGAQTVSTLAYKAVMTQISTMILVTNKWAQCRLNFQWGLEAQFALHMLNALEIKWWRLPVFRARRREHPRIQGRARLLMWGICNGCIRLLWSYVWGREGGYHKSWVVIAKIVGHFIKCEAASSRSSLSSPLHKAQLLLS